VADGRPRRGNQAVGVGLVLGSVLLEAVVVGAWAWRNGVNADEGFYIAAAARAAQGQQLYGDVFFPQMPYLPWFLAAVFRLAEPSLDLARGVSVAAAAIAAGLLTAIVWLQERRADTTAIAAFLLVANALVIDSLSVTKTSALVNVTLLAAFAPIALGKVRHPVWACLAGVASGLAIGVRLPVAAVVVVFALLVLREGLLPFAAFVLGGVLASLPWLVAAARFPDQFWFCNVTFHSLRREMTGGSAILGQKVGIIAKWLLLPQHALLWALAGVSLWWDWRRVWPPAAAALVLALAYAAATPTYLEYMSQFIAFLILAGLPAIALLARHRMVAAGVLGAYLLGCYGLVKPVPVGTAMAADRALWARGTVDEVSNYLRAHAAADEPVLSWWEGYPVLSGRPGFVGVGFWESNVAKKIDRTAAQRYHVMQRDQLSELVQAREPGWIVVDDGTWPSLRESIDAGYQSARRVGPVQIYQRRPPTAATAEAGARAEIQ
jgi:hypothetical protein